MQRTTDDVQGFPKRAYNFESHAIGAALPIHRVLEHFSKVMRGCAVLLEANASFLVIFNYGMGNFWSMSRYTIPAMVVSMKKKGL
jgi:hypothetical protein